MNQPQVYMSPPSRTFLPPPTPSHASRLSQSIRFEFPASYSQFSVAICFAYGNVCFHTTLSHFLSKMQMFWNFLRSVCQGTATVYLYLFAVPSFMFPIPYKLSLLPPFWLWYNLCGVFISWNLLLGEEERVRNVKQPENPYGRRSVLVRLIKTEFLILWFCYSERYSWTRPQCQLWKELPSPLSREVKRVYH